MKEYSQIMGYFILTVVLLSLVGGGLKLLGVFGERVIYENSFQYKQGMKSRALTLQAQIAEVDSQMVQFPDKYATLQAQRKVLKIQLQATQL